jgi:hypothetical protein
MPAAPLGTGRGRRKESAWCAADRNPAAGRRGRHRARDRVEPLAKARGEHDAELADSPYQTLDYRVSDGQDPAVVLSALSDAGYDAAIHPSPGSRSIHIECRTGRDRERAHVRAVIESSAVTAIDDGLPLSAVQGSKRVRFVDE